MNRADPRAVLSQIHRLTGGLTADDVPDRELLDRYRGRRDQAAFAVLVRRYGPLVWGVCRRVLGNEHDAEDAFQAAFLVLAKKAGSIRRAESLGAWLHRVARQLAQRARARRDRRQQFEKCHRVNGTAGGELSEELSLREALSILDEELGRLPEKFRAPAVLCYLQGKTNEDAARALGCAAGTLKSRLGRARQLLGRRLAARGVALPAGAAAVLLATNAGEAALPAAVSVAAAFSMHETAGASAEALRLAHELMGVMTMHRIKLWAAGLLALALVGTGVGALVRQAAWGGAFPGASAPAEGDTPAEQPSAKADLHGDPLPPGALARLGTVRWRHGARASVLVYAAGGKEVVTAGPDGLARVWNAATGKELRRLGKPAEPAAADAIFVRPAALSADGRRAATWNDGVRVWEVGTGKELRRFGVENKEELVAVALTPDGQGLLISSMGAKLVLWDVETGKERRRFEFKDAGAGQGEAPPFGVGGVVFSPDGKLLAAPDIGGLVKENASAGVRLWDVATGKEVLTIAKPLKDNEAPAEVSYPAFSPDGKVIAWAAPDGSIRLHGTADDKEKRSLGKPAKDASAAGLAFAPDGKTLAAFLSDRTVQLYDTATGKELHRLAEGPARPPEAANRANAIRFLDYPLYNPDAPPLAFAPDGKTLAVVSGENAVRLWNTTTGKPLPWPSGHSGVVVELAVSADGKTVVTCGTDGMLRRWERATGKQLGEAAIPGDGYAGTLSPTGRLLACVDETTVRVWDVAAKKDVVKLELPEDIQGQSQVYLTKFSADEKVLAAVDPGGTIRLWDAATGKELRKLTTPPGADAQAGGLMSLLEFSRDGRTLLAVQTASAVLAAPAPGPGAKPAAPEAPEGPKSVLFLWDTATGTLLRRWEAKGNVTGVAFTPDGHALATAAADHVTVWEVATAKERFHRKGAVALVSCSPDGRVLAVAAGSLVRLIDLRSGKEFGRLKGHDADVEALAFTADGKALVSGSADSTALVWGGAPLVPPARKIDEQSADKLAELWPDLGDADAGKGFRAAMVFGSSPKGAAALLAERIKPVAGPDAKQVARWINDLDSDSFDVREKAAAELGKLGELARPALEEALKKERSAEVRRRIDELLGRLKPGQTLSAEDLRRLRTVEVLEDLGTPEAKQLLEELAKGAPGAALTRDAAAALRRLNAEAAKP